MVCSITTCYPVKRTPRRLWCVRGLGAGRGSRKLTYFGLYALQHRGQESAGIAAVMATKSSSTKRWAWYLRSSMKRHSKALDGYLAIGHARYSTTGASVWENAQPTFRRTATGNLALGHNGNLTNTAELAQRLAETIKESGELQLGQVPTSTSDTELMTALLAGHPDISIEQAAMVELPRMRVRSPGVHGRHDPVRSARSAGIRPLVLGELETGWVVASETAALDIVGAKFVRDILPGELVAIDGDGVRSQRFAEAEPKACLFEYVYLPAQTPRSMVKHYAPTTRVEVGRRLAKGTPVETDLVIPVPESGTPGAVGYAQASGIPFAQAS